MKDEIGSKVLNVQKIYWNVYFFAQSDRKQKPSFSNRKERKSIQVN